jgi:hypothetical protein
MFTEVERAGAPTVAPERAEIGRVLRASTAGFAIGSRVSQLSEPGFGCLVKAQPVDQGEAVYAIVYDMHIDDDQLIRRLVMAEQPRSEVIEDQRRNRMLPIEMDTLTLGYQLNGVLMHGLPPRPPLNLDPVYMCSAAEIAQFTSRLGYLRLILRAAASNVPVDQLLVAHIRRVIAERPANDGWAQAVVAEVIQLLRSNYEMLVPTLEALSEAL